MPFHAFSTPELSAVAESVLEGSPVAGMDKVGRIGFRNRLDENISVLHRRLGDGSYTFTRYRLQLQGKGPQKPPREIVIPTFRDRVALRAVLAVLQRHMASDVDREIPNAKIRRLRRYLAEAPGDVEFVRLDVTDFFGTIPHSGVMIRLESRGVDRLVRDLTRRAIRQTHLKGSQRDIGLPQGLCISPLLANAYIREFYSDPACLLLRHLDDILLVGPAAMSCEQSMVAAIEGLSLRINTEKTQRGRLSDRPFTFLGYEIDKMRVRASERGCQRFLASIEKIIGQHAAKTAYYFRRSMTNSARDATFVRRLNRRIAGAKFRNHQYGWIAYYGQISDAAQLEWLDRVIHRMLERRGLLGVAASLESLTAIWARRKAGLLVPSMLDYDAIATPAQWHSHLVAVGELDGNADADIERIQTLFERARSQDLSDMEQDVGLWS